MVSFRVKFKISDEHPRPFHMGFPPPPPGVTDGLRIHWRTEWRSKDSGGKEALKFGADAHGVAFPFGLCKMDEEVYFSDHLKDCIVVYELYVTKSMLTRSGFFFLIYHLVSNASSWME